MHDFTDVTYEVDESLAWITINRPERHNAFRARTVDALPMTSSGKIRKAMLRQRHRTQSAASLA
jgi:1,4-dihydroxy-2-naphthoyl-CoA synthase